MSLNVGRAMLNEALSELQTRWERTSSSWNDSVSNDIEKQHLAPLEPKIRTAIAAMATMQEIISKARSDCR